MAEKWWARLANGKQYSREVFAEWTDPIGERRLRRAWWIAEIERGVGQTFAEWLGCPSDM
jgi:hypothetical protein